MRGWNHMDACFFIFNIIKIKKSNWLSSCRIILSKFVGDIKEVPVFPGQSWSFLVMCNDPQQGHPYPACEGRSFQHGINFEGPRLTSFVLTKVWISTFGRSLFLFDWSSLLCGVFVFSFSTFYERLLVLIFFFFLIANVPICTLVSQV